MTATVVMDVSPSVIMESLMKIAFLPGATYFLLILGMITLRIRSVWPDQVDTHYQTYHQQEDGYALSAADSGN